MSTNVGKTWHLSAETRWILVNLRDAIQHNLDLDEKGNSSDFSGHWSLLPWIYKAFTKIWCRKCYCVKKVLRSRVSYCDIHMVLVDKVSFDAFRSAYNRELKRERDTVSLDDEFLPF